MAFTSVDNMLTCIQGGQTLTCSYEKTIGAGSYAAGRWFNTFTFAGTPSTGSYSGSALAMQTATDASFINAGAWYHGGNKSPSIKNIINIEAFSSSAASAPIYFLLVDILAYYPGINLNSGSAQTFTGSNAGVNILPNRNGVQHTGNNVFAFLEAGSTLGATPSTVAITYTNQGAAANGHTLNTTVNYVASSIVGQIIHSAAPATAGTYGPFLPLQSGDLGISSVQSITVGASGSASTGTLVLCEPIARIPLVAISTPTARDFVYNFPSLPTIKDGACLSLLAYPSVAVSATNYIVEMDVAWG